MFSSINLYVEVDIDYEYIYIYIYILDVCHGVVSRLEILSLRFRCIVKFCIKCVKPEPPNVRLIDETSQWPVLVMAICICIILFMIYNIVQSMFYYIQSIWGEHRCKKMFRIS